MVLGKVDGGLTTVRDIMRSAETILLHDYVPSLIQQQELADKLFALQLVSFQQLSNLIT